MEEMGHSPVHAAIDQGSVVWSIAQVCINWAESPEATFRTVGRCHSIAQ